MFKSVFGSKKPQNDDRASYKVYKKKHKMEEGKEEDKRECPVCLLEFEDDDKVQGLQCSNLHIYHKDCLDDVIGMGDDKCSLCR